MPVRNPGKALRCFGEDGVLGVRKAVVRLVRVRHVRRQTFDFNAGESAQGFRKRDRFVDRHAEAVEAGIYLHVDRHHTSLGDGLTREGLPQFKRMAGQGKGVMDRFPRIFAERMAQDENGTAYAGFPERNAFGDPHHGEAVRSPGIQFARERWSPGAVGVGLDDRDELDGPQDGAELRRVVGESAEVNLDPGVERPRRFGERSREVSRECQLTPPFPGRLSALLSRPGEPSID